MYGLPCDMWSVGVIFFLMLGLNTEKSVAAAFSLVVFRRLLSIRWS